MTFYQTHLFFCVNVRENDRKCCKQAGSSEMLAYAKKRTKALGIKLGEHNIRVNKSGCLGRCAEGPILVIYPEGVWYTYHTEADIDEILERHIIKGEKVDRLLI